MVQSSLKVKMLVKFAEGRMKLLSMEYKSLLRTHGLTWVTEKTPKVFIRKVFSFIKPAVLRPRLGQGSGFPNILLKHDFSWFMQHTIALSDAFERVDYGTPKASGSEKDLNKKIASGHKEYFLDRARANANSKSVHHKKKTQPEPSTLPSSKRKNHGDWISDCN